MSPNAGPVPQSNLYTAILGIACAVAIATAAYVAYMCYVQYETVLPT